MSAAVLPRVNVRFDLFGDPPYYTVMVEQPPAGPGAKDAGASRGELSSGGGQTRRDLDAMRADILADLTKIRDEIFGSIRGDNAGPTMIPREAPINRTQADAIFAMAAREKDPRRKAELLYLANLELAYAIAMAAAQQVVQDAVMAGADWILGDARYQHAKLERQRLARLAAAAYNAGLPLGYTGMRKDEGAWGV